MADAWENVPGTSSLQRMRVPGGWIYRARDEGIAFVPEVAAASEPVESDRAVSESGELSCDERSMLEARGVGIVRLLHVYRVDEEAVVPMRAALVEDGRVLTWSADADGCVRRMPDEYPSLEDAVDDHPGTVWNEAPVGIYEIPSLVVHAVITGRTVCDLGARVDGQWPDGHTYALEHRFEDVTCTDCKTSVHRVVNLDGHHEVVFVDGTRIRVDNAKQVEIGDNRAEVKIASSSSGFLLFRAKSLLRDSVWAANGLFFSPVTKSGQVDTGYAEGAVARGRADGGLPVPDVHVAVGPEAVDEVLAPISRCGRTMPDGGPCTDEVVARVGGVRVCRHHLLGNSLPAYRQSWQAQPGTVRPRCEGHEEAYAVVRWKDEPTCAKHFWGILRTASEGEIVSFSAPLFSSTRGCMFIPGRPENLRCGNPAVALVYFADSRQPICGLCLSRFHWERVERAIYPLQRDEDADGEADRRSARIDAEVARLRSVTPEQFERVALAAITAIWSAVDDLQAVRPNLHPVDVVEKHLQRGNIVKDGDW